MKQNNSVEIWRQALREHRERAHLSYKEIAERANLSEKTVSRVFTGEAKNPGVDIIRRIIHALGVRWVDIFGESEAVITTENVDAVKSENTALHEENESLKSRIKELESEAMLLRVKFEYEQKINGLLMKNN